MFVFPPGSGCTGEPRLVKPGDPLIFANSDVYEAECSERPVESSLISRTVCDGIDQNLTVSSEKSQKDLPIVAR